MLNRLLVAVTAPSGAWTLGCHWASIAEEGAELTLESSGDHCLTTSQNSSDMLGSSSLNLCTLFISALKCMYAYLKGTSDLSLPSPPPAI